VKEKRISEDSRILNFLKNEKKITLKKGYTYSVVVKKKLVPLGQTNYTIEL
jgi:hypothetical protein